MNDDPVFVIDGPLILEIMGYLMAKPMQEVEPMVNKLRALRQANVVPEVASE